MTEHDDKQANKRNTGVSRLIWIVAVGALAVGVFLLRPAADRERATEEQVTAAADQDASRALPRLLDLGADKCVHCKLMAPILEELKTEYAGRLVVEFIDVWKNPDAGTPYGIKIIPTQIFFAADGTELFRHEGFMSKEDILARCTELGFEL